MKTNKRSRPVFITFALGLVSALAAQADQVNLAWDAPLTNTDGSPFTNLACYVVYCGTAPGQYDFGVDAGTDTQVTVTGLQSGVTYYFTVEAMNTWNCQSELSAEISATPGSSPPLADADMDGMPDAWEIANFGSVNSFNGSADYDLDGDGFTTLEEYIAGTDPKNAESGPFIETTAVRRFLIYTFEALAAYPGAGTRYYALERTASLATPVWTAVPGYEAIAGQDQLVSYQERVKKRYYYRLNIWLQ